MELLVIGATGYIGSQIYCEALKRNIKVIGTKFQSQNKEFVQFNIVNDKIEDLVSKFNGNNKVAVICSANAKIDYCYDYKDEAYKINVTATVKLLNELKALNYKIIFLSTDNVFDGKRGNYTEKDVQCPINEYGKMKTIVEKYIVENIQDACIMRIGKIIGLRNHKNDMLTEWMNQAKNSEKIYCIKDNIFTPTHVEDIVNSFFIIAERKLKGVYNIVGNEHFSRKSMALKFLNYTGLKTDIIEKDISEFNFKDNRPLNICMNNNKFINETSYHFKSMEIVFKEFNKNIEAVKKQIIIKRRKK